jgi:hypothetical protein
MQDAPLGESLRSCGGEAMLFSGVHRLQVAYRLLCMFSIGIFYIQSSHHSYASDLWCFHNILLPFIVYRHAISVHKTQGHSLVFVPRRDVRTVSSGSSISSLAGHLAFTCGRHGPKTFTFCSFILTSFPLLPHQTGKQLIIICLLNSKCWHLWYESYIHSLQICDIYLQSKYSLEVNFNFLSIAYEMLTSFQPSHNCSHLTESLAPFMLNEALASLVVNPLTTSTYPVQTCYNC